MLVFGTGDTRGGFRRCWWAPLALSAWLARQHAARCTRLVMAGGFMVFAGLIIRRRRNRGALSTLP
jgi:hypothetical protein